jgi:hypothetical protein
MLIRAYLCFVRHVDCKSKTNTKHFFISKEKTVELIDTCEYFKLIKKYLYLPASCPTKFAGTYRPTYNVKPEAGHNVLIEHPAERNNHKIP